MEKPFNSNNYDENSKINKLIKSNLKLKYKINFNMDFEPITEPVKLVFTKLVPKSEITSNTDKKVKFYNEHIKTAGLKRQRLDVDKILNVKPYCNYESTNTDTYENECYCYGCTMGGECYRDYESITIHAINNNYQPITKKEITNNYQPITKQEIYSNYSNIKLSSILFKEDQLQHVEAEEEQQCCKNLSDLDYIMHFKYDHKYNH